MAGPNYYFGYNQQPNQHFPVGYQPAQIFYPNNAAQQNNSFQSQPQIQQQPNSNVIWVQGEAGAKAFNVMSGQSVLLMDSEAKRFYIKMVDQNGVPQSLLTYDYSEHVEEQPKVSNVDMSSYVTKDDLNAKLAEQQGYVTMDQLRNFINELRIGEQGRIVINEPSV